MGAEPCAFAFMLILVVMLLIALLIGQMAVSLQAKNRTLLAMTRERLHYADLAQANQVQIESERLRTAILSSLSHDLRTPLTALVGLTEILNAQGGQLPPVQQERVEAVHEQAVRLAGMVNHLLDLARLSAGKLSLRKEWQSLEDVTGSALRLLKPVLSPCRVQVNIPPDFPLLAFDAVLMERVIGNLLENSVKHTTIDTMISITAQIVGEHAEVCIVDHGSGFPLHVLSATPALTTAAKPLTTGLGLVICEAILKAHQGKLSLEQHEGGGACARFTLPLGKPPAIEDEPEPEEEDSPYG